MSTLHELRTVLEKHADSLHDTEQHARAAAVHRRVRGVRRRRTASVAVAAVVAVVASVVAVDALQAPDDVVPSKQFHGVDVPTEVELAAGTYELDELTEMEPGKEIDFPYPETLTRRAIALVATGLGEGSATLFLNGRTPIARLTGDQELSPAFAYLPFSLEVRLEGAPDSAHVGFAAYDGPDTAFPERHMDDVLAASATSDGTSAELTVTAALADLELAPVCPSIEGRFTLTVDGKVRMDAESCSSHYRNEDGSITTVGDLGEDERVREHTVRIERTEPGVLLAAYVRGDGPEVLGQQVAETVEAAGRTWVLDDVVEQDEPAASFTTSVTTDEDDRFVDFVSVGYSQVTITSERGGTCEALSTQDLYTSCMPILLSGDAYEFAITGNGENDFQVAMLVYRPQ